MDRKAELQKLCTGMSEHVKTLVMPMMDELVYIEEQLALMREVPIVKVEVSKKDPTRKRVVISPTFPVYRALCQQQRNAIRAILKSVDETGVGGSPLRDYLNRLKEQDDLDEKEETE